MRIVSEEEFAARLRFVLQEFCLADIGAVTGPGRSGAIAAVYASHILHVPFIPYGQACPEKFRLLIIDTARESGRTLRKATRRYRDCDPVVIAVYEEPPRVAFWYEAPKPQFYRHEIPLLEAA
ncbi:hypothetical protein [Bradyrhizobium sp. SZCCHNS3053]|uniref:hypothetical protein n=1 Tax=Bradyrhizobium sp. SZCCHNS3053 TaxID=3057322 RepID=UPI002915E0A5|nr:hypothetical protein [Bradyrhizobium sp. SZCCHNS3053]